MQEGGEHARSSAHIIFVCDLQNLSPTPMTHNRKINIECFYLHNGIQLSHEKGGHNEFFMQRNGTRNYKLPGSGNSELKTYACYTLTNKIILGKKVQNSQDTELKEDNNPNGPITLGREKKTITRVKKDLGGYEIGRGRGIT